jgi:hypothetical protein
MVVVKIVETTADSAMRKVTRLESECKQVSGGRSAHAYGQCGFGGSDGRQDG